MARKTKYIALKNELKQLAADIRIEKASHRKAQQALSAHRTYLENTSPRPAFDLSLPDAVNDTRISQEVSSSMYREMHVAYCLLRGRTMEQIEPKSRKLSEGGKLLDMKEVQRVMDEHRALVEAGNEKAVCAD
jgi:hypothetical protein